MKRKSNLDAAPHQWGSLGGRGCHPIDPTGAVFGPRHWPMPLPHEKNQPMAEVAPVKKERPPPAPRPATTTGLITKQDFLDEVVKVLGRTDAELNTKIAKWFTRSDVGEGMKRMQCNLLIRNALKRKEKHEAN